MDRETEATIEVTVNDNAWTRVSSLRNAGPNDHSFVLDADSNRIIFGDGTHGSKPEVGSTVSVSYRYGAGSSGNISKQIDDGWHLINFWVVARSDRQAVGWGKVID